MNFLKYKYFFIFIIIIIAFILRIHGIMDQDLWADEVVTYRFSEHSFLKLIKMSILDTHPPVFNIILKFWILLFGKSIFILRLLSVILGITTIFILYNFVKNKFNFFIAILSSLFLTFSPLHIWYCQIIRPYSFLPLLFLIETISFLNIIKKFSKKNIFYFIISSIILCYTHYFGVFICFSYCIYLILFSKYKIKSLNLSLIILLFFSPWIYIIFKYQYNVLAVSKTINFSKFYPINFFSKLILGYSSIEFSHFFLALIIILFFYFCIYSCFKNNYFIPLFLSCIFIYLISFLISFFIKDLYGQRFYCATLPILFILFSYSLYLINNSILKNSMILIFLFLFSINIYLMKTDSFYIHNDFRTIIKIIKTQKKQINYIIISDDIHSEIFNYYSKLEIPIITFKYNVKQYKITKNLKKLKGNIIFLIHPKNLIPFKSAEPFLREFLEKNCRNYKIIKKFNSNQLHERVPSSYEVILAEI